jgi:hypothetical protein
VKFKTGVKFQGNIIFSSENSQAYLEQSRRDDFISLVYLLVFFANGKLPWFDGHLNKSDKRFFQNVSRMKQDLIVTELCCDRASFLIPFAQEVF